MSFLDTANLRLDWLAAQPKTSLRVEAGCVQCGSRLEMDNRGQYEASGKCFNCVNWISDEDEDTADLED